MVRAERKQLVYYLFLTLSFYVTEKAVHAEEDTIDFDIVNAITHQTDLDEEQLSAPESSKSEEKKVIHDSSPKAQKNVPAKKNKKAVSIDPTKRTDFPKTIIVEERNGLQEKRLIIRNIYIIGNQTVTTDSIMHRSPFKKGEIFNINYSSTLLKNLYKTGYFHQIKLYADTIDPDKVDLYIKVQEKPRFKEFIFEGVHGLTEKDLKKELNAEKILTLDQAELKPLCSKLRKLYQKKNYHHAEIKGELVPHEDGTVSAHLKIDEGKKSYLSRISFVGNKHVPSKRLKRILISKEDWILGMLDGSGSYNSLMLEGDKYMIEDSYKSNGFMNAKVIATDAIQNPETGNYELTFHIHEGDCYLIKSVSAEGNETLSEQELKTIIGIEPGQYYSQEKIRQALDNLKLVWGEQGYIFADIDPGIEVHEEEKAVSLTFHTDLKEKVYLNRLTIRGNKKSKDEVIRRNIILDEGELITNRKMDISKNRVNLLNYFDPKNGVNWKINRLNSELADLDLMLIEKATGHFNFNLGYGGAPGNRQSPTTGMNFTCAAGDHNLFGTGIAASIAAELSKRYRSCNATIIDPWLFHKPIRGSLNGYVKKSEYDSIDIAQNPPFEQAVGGNASVGYMTPRLNGFLVEGVLSYEKISYDQDIKAANYLGRQKTLAQIILDQNFLAGSQISVICNLSQDKRDGMVFTTRGHQWTWVNQLTVPGSTFAGELQDAGEPQYRQSRFQYFKSEIDVSWYTPLINEFDLVMCIHGNAGFIYKFHDKQVPWRMLYHVGGPTTIRGYLYGQVGPNWNDTSLGALKGFNVNVEFIAPLSSNMNTRAVLFYDGGAGWDTPYYNTIVRENSAFAREIQNNNFFYRHSVGIGIRMKTPTPLQVDFGIKLNPSRKFRKELTQLHLNVEHAF